MMRQSRRRFIGHGLPWAGLGWFSGCGTRPPRTEQPATVPRVGYLTSAGMRAGSSNAEAFRQSLQEVCWIAGQNIVVEYRYAEEQAERLPALVNELVRLPADIIVAVTTPAAKVAQQATSSVPVVFTAVGDPVESGLVGSLTRPGGNLTGTRQRDPQL